MAKPVKIKALSNDGPGRRKLPSAERKVTIGIGLKPHEVARLDAECKLQFNLDRSNMARRSLLAWLTLNDLMRNGLIAHGVLEKVHERMAKDAEDKL